MHVLVTGCAGFIGFHLTQRLLDEGHRVDGLDNLCTGQERNAADLSRHERFTLCRHDLARPLPPEVADGRFDLICNLACPASPVDFAAMRLEILDVCSNGMRNLLELAQRCGALLLHTSTSEVYGDPKEHPQKETYWGNVNPIGPRSCYDEGKRFAEALTVAYREKYGVRTRTARIFNTYGPRMRANDGRALPAFISQALDNQPITIHGDGRQTRSFCYVSDMVDGLLKLAAGDDPGPMNIGNPAEITILDIAREVVRLAGSRSEIIHVERPKDDPQLRRPDITLATQRLGWRPRVERDQGLRSTIEWFRSSRAS